MNATASAEDTAARIARLQANAISRSGFDDFGSDAYLAPLGMLIEETQHKGGRDFWDEEITTALIGRLVREAEWKANPAYRDRSIKAPLVICGIPRTGTTALHKLLSVDPQFQGLDHWLTAWPKPRPPRATWPQEPGFLHAVEILQKRFADVPGMLASHEIVADEVDECLEVLRLDFVANRFPSMTSLPSYDRWFQAQDETPFYRRLADTLRLIGLDDDRTWLLKNPGHFGHLDSLFAVFPDARVVITHRDPVKSIPSLCSVLEHAHRLIDPEADLAKVAKREIAYWTRAKRDTERQRQQLPADRFVDVDHIRFHADPIGVVRQIYGHFGLELAPEVEAGMLAWLKANPADKHGEHHYTLDHFSISAEEIRAALGEG